MRYRAKKAILVTSLLAALASGTMFYNTKPSQGTTSLALAKQPQPKVQSTGTATTGTPSSGAAANVPMTQASYQTKSGTFTGGREYAYYGYVQVQAVVQNGQLQKVNVLEHPNDNGTSRYINSVAMPYLVQEAVQAQSSRVSLISGATLSSEAFVKSLSSALSKAQG